MKRNSFSFYFPTESSSHLSALGSTFSVGWGDSIKFCQISHLQNIVGLPGKTFIHSININRSWGFHE
jgi:hypothetical protein